MVRDAAVLAARLLLAVFFVAEGWLKIGAFRDVAGYMEAHGVSPLLLPAVIAVELGGGLLVAAGLLTRWASLALAGFCLLAALLFHAAWDEGDQFIQFGKNLGLAGGFLLLAATGGGRISLDGALGGAIAGRITRR